MHEPVLHKSCRPNTNVVPTACGLAATRQRNAPQVANPAPVYYHGLDTIMSNLALTNRLRQRRLDRKWSQQELAERAGIARASVSAIEMGRLVPSAASALALAAALNCRVEDLFQLASAPA